MFDVARSCLYAHRERARHIDVERMALRSRVHELFVESRSSAGSRSIMGMMREEGTAIGRFKVSRLMEELGLVCEQPGSHAYKQATVERVDIPNHLNREFTVGAPNQVWCGDITYVWAQGRWHYLAVMLDLFARRAVGWAFSLRPDADIVVYRKRWKWLKSSEGDLRGCCFIRIRVASSPVKNSVSACGAIGYNKVCVAGEIVGITPRRNGCSAASKRNGCRQQDT